MILTILVLLLLLTVLVLVHEAGHFFVAKKFRIKVEEFGFGFPPRLFGKKRGETVYSINALPIGGFVKLYGEDDAGAAQVKLKVESSKLRAGDIDRAFFARSPWQRAVVVVAGVVMNIILAVVIFYVFLFISNFKTTLPLLNNHTFYFVDQKTFPKGVVVRNVAKGSPAQDAGMKPPVKIISVNNKSINEAKQFMAIVNSNKGREVNIKWQEVESGEIFEKQLVPRLNPPKNQGAIGVGLGDVPFSTVELSYNSSAQKIFSGIVHPFNILFWQVDMLGSLIQKSVREKSAAAVSGAVSGPIGIGYVVGGILQIPNLKDIVLQLLNLAGIFSITLAFFNILPIPALDGGRLFFILVEGITRKKVSAELESKIHAAGMVALLALMVMITYQDILKFILKTVPIM